MKQKIKEEKQLTDFFRLATKIKKWFDEREIETGYTDTNVGHLALLVKDEVSQALDNQKKELIEKIKEWLPTHKGKMIARSEIKEFLETIENE